MGSLQLGSEHRALPCRTPFVLHRAPLESLDAVGSLGTRMRALSLSAAQQQRQRRTPATGAPEQEAAPPVQRRCPVVLILDDSLQSLPWESLPALRSQRCGSALQLLLHQRTPRMLSHCSTLSLMSQARCVSSGLLLVNSLTRLC